MINRQEFSVLMSLYEKESPENFRKSLDSIFDQTLRASEVILMIDGPIGDKLKDVISEYAGHNLKIIQIEKNEGLGLALRKGIDECSHEIIVRMDTDDICYRNRFEKQITYMENNNHVSILGSSIQEFQQRPGDLNQFRKLPLDYKSIMEFSKYRNPLNHPSVVFRKSHVQAVGSYEDMPLFEDYYLWIRILVNGYVIENLGEPLLHFRIGNDMIGRRHGFSYVKKEFSFLKKARNIHFLNKTTFVKSIIFKLPLRLLPKQLLAIFYKLLLR